MDGNGYDLRNSDCFPSFRRTEICSCPESKIFAVGFPLLDQSQKGMRTLVCRPCSLLVRHSFRGSASYMQEIISCIHETLPSGYLQRDCFSGVQ